MNSSKRVTFIIDAQDNASKKLKDVRDNASVLERSFGVLGSTVKATAQVVAAAGTALSIAGVFSLKTAGQLEAAQQGFVALLGSAEKARLTMDRIKREAAATPFELTGLTVGAQALAAITKDGDKAIDTLLDVGKAIATSGKGQAELDRVILNLQQVASTGKVTEMDIRQFQGAIPIFNDILKASGLTTESIKDSEQGAKLLFDAFKKAGQEGGITAAGFTSQAGTFNQLWSNVKDTLTITGSEFVKQTGLFDAAKNAMSAFISFIGQNQGSIIELGKAAGAAFMDFVRAIQSAIAFIQGLFSDTSTFYQFISVTLVPAFMLVKDTAVTAWAEIREALKPIMPELQMLAKVFGVVLVGAIIAVINIIAVLVSAFIAAFKDIVKVVAAAVDFLQKLFQAWALVIYAIIEAFKGNWKVAGELIKQVFTGAINYAKGLLESFVNLFVKQINKVIETINKIPGVSVKKVKEFALEEKAVGGPVKGNTPYIVGEKGPELFMPAGSGTIIPNNRLAGGANLTFIFNGDIVDKDQFADTITHRINRELELSRYGIG